MKYEVPEAWDWAHLEQIGTVGSSRRVTKSDWTKEGVPFYRAREVVKLSKNGFVENDLFISTELYEELASSGQVPEAGDVLLTGVGTIGVPYEVKKQDHFYFKDASVLIFKNEYKLDPSYLYLFFCHPTGIEPYSILVLAVL